MSKSKEFYQSSNMWVLLLIGLLLLLNHFRKPLQGFLDKRQVPTLRSSQEDNMTARVASNAIRRILRNRSNLSELAIERLLALARHETGNFTSAIFRENNNPWGMKVAVVRTTTNIGENRGHARYRNLEDAVVDMIHYLISFRTNPGDFANISSFAQELKNDRYYEDTVANYTRGLLRWYRGAPDTHQNIIPLPRWQVPVIIR